MSLLADRFLENGRKTADLQKRKEIYFDLQKLPFEDPPRFSLLSRGFPNIQIIYFDIEIKYNMILFEMPENRHFFY